MNKQEIFDKVSTHLATQGRRARSGDDICVYRNSSGLSCAAGCLIPNELYDRGMEGDTINNLVERYPKLKEYLGEENIEMIHDLQHIHDTLYTNLYEEFSIIAKVYNLDMSVVNSLTFPTYWE